MYHIAGLNFLFKPDIAISNPVFHKYITDDNNKADTVVNFIKCKQLASPDGMLLLNDVIKWYINDKTKNSYFAYYPDISDTKKMVCRFDFDYEWKNVTISYLMDAPNIEYLIINLFGNLIMRNLVLFHKGIILHASAIKYMEKAILFTAPSGTGKSTHTKMWEKFHNALIINDDTPVIRLMNNKPIAYGTPWSGFKLINSNDFAGLHAIVVLEQSNENKIHRLNKHEMIKHLLPRFFLPYQDNQLMETAFSIFSRIIEVTPVFLLQCRPDKQALDLAYKTVVEDIQDII